MHRTTPDQVTLLGDGVVSLTVDLLGYSSITVTVELAANATTGARSILVYQAAPKLGMQSPLGSADMFTVTVNP